ncbi:MAG: hypothetical protein WKF66_19055 [Pedobacter sp.]
MNNKHHGQLIEKIVRRNGHSITDIARLTHVNRRSVYNWFNQARLKPRTISCIGEAIQFDFTAMFPEFKEEMSNKKPKQIEHAADRIMDSESYHWKDKYIELLERHAKLLTQVSDR